MDHFEQNFTYFISSWYTSNLQSLKIYFPNKHELFFFQAKIAPKTQSSVEKSILEAVPLENNILHNKVKVKTPEERINELESKLSAVSKENETYKKILDKEQHQLKVRKFQNEIVES